MHNVSFGNLAIFLENQPKKTEELYNQLKQNSKVKSVKGDHYSKRAFSVDNRLFSDDNSAQISEINLEANTTEDECELMKELHQWAQKNQVEIRINIDKEEYKLGRVRIIDYSEDTN